MPQAEIEIQFEQMKELAEKLSGTAGELRQVVDNKGMETLSKTKAAWISENADIFIGKEVKLFESISETAMNLKSLSEEICEKAKLIYEMEQRNTLMAKIRIYI